MREQIEDKVNEWFNNPTNVTKLTRFLSRRIPESYCDDVAQETYLRAIKHANTYTGQAKLGTWIFAISINLANDQLRRQNRPKSRIEFNYELLDDLPEYFLVHPQDLFDAIEQKLTLERITGNLSFLTDKQIGILNLKREGYTGNEICESLGITLPALKGQYNETLRKLSSYYGNNR